MDKKFKRIISIFGLFLVFSYLAVVIIFVIAGSEIFLTIMEIITIISAFYILLLLETVLIDSDMEHQIQKHFALISMAGCIILTSSAHIVNLTVTRSLISRGVNVPIFFQIGQWPSVEMALDYLAWGLFLGIAFICTAFTIKKNYETILKWTLLVCGCFCIIGFIGAMINFANLWYIAVLGYTVGLAVICIEQIKLNRKRRVL